MDKIKLKGVSFVPHSATLILHAVIYLAPWKTHINNIAMEPSSAKV